MSAPAPTPADAALCTIGEACERLGVSPRTLRYYEELGFVRPARSAGGHRLYGPGELETVRRIGRMQAVGFSLRTIGNALRYRAYRDQTGRSRLSLDALRELAAEARADAAAVRERIGALRHEVEIASREAEGLEHDSAFLAGLLAAREIEEAPGGARG